MKTRIFALVVVTLVLITLFYPVKASADTFSYKGDGVISTAFFSSVDDSGIQTNVYISVSDFKAHFAPEPQRFSESVIQLQIHRFDSTCPYFVTGCPGLIMNVSTIDQLADKDYSAPAVSPGSRANLDTTVNVFDRVSNTSFDVHIDLNWTCIGDVFQFQEPSHFVVPGEFVSIAVYGGRQCPAQAAGYIATGLTNYTPKPSYQTSDYPTWIASSTSVEIGASTSP